MILLFSLSLAAHLRAQETTFPADSTRFLPGKSGAIRIDTLLPPPKQTKSPGTAMLLSAVLPGAGQFYNQSYWKVPVVAGLGIYFVAEWFSNNKTFKDYQSQYEASLAANPAGNDNLLRLREFYRDQRDTFTWYFVILYFINILDAYVDASLFDFDVGDNLTLRVLPDAGTPQRPAAGLSIRLGF